MEVAEAAEAAAPRSVTQSATLNMVASFWTLTPQHFILALHALCPNHSLYALSALISRRLEPSIQLRKSTTKFCDNNVSPLPPPLSCLPHCVHCLAMTFPQGYVNLKSLTVRDGK